MSECNKIRYIGFRLIFGLFILQVLCILISDYVLPMNQNDRAYKYVDTNDFVFKGKIYKIEEKNNCRYLYVQDEYKDSVICIDTGEKKYYIGNTIYVEGVFELFGVDRNPGNFNEKQYYSNLGIHGKVYANKVSLVDNTINKVENYLYNSKIKGIEILNAEMNDTNASLMIAMIFGDKSNIDSNQKERFQKIGISHIFAISGLHISLICMGIYKLIRRITGSYIIGGVVGIIFLAMYILMIGVSVSSIRAGIMFCIGIGASITGRVYDLKTSLAWAGIYLLFQIQERIYEASFLLSVGALLGLIYIVPILNILLEKLGRIGKSLSVSLGILIMILPILLEFFYEVCPYSPIVNLILLPFVPIILILGILALFIYPYGVALTRIMFTMCELLLYGMNTMSEIIIELPFSRIIIGKMWAYMIVLYYIILFVMIILGNKLIRNTKKYIHSYGDITKGKKGVTKYENKNAIMKLTCIRNLRYLCYIFLILLVLPLIIKSPREDIQITMLDVGQGDSIYIKGPNKGSYLIDGGSTDINSVGKYRIEQYLLSIGVASLDYVFLSHGDSDHYSGIVEMMNRQQIGVKIEKLVVVAKEFHDEKTKEVIDVARENGVTVLEIKEGDVIKEGDLYIKCLAPVREYSGEIGNASSMVLDVSYENFSILFTGDLENQGEVEFLEKYKNLLSTYTVLKVAHHGSKNSTPEKFLETIEPKIAIISAGINSRYGHPHSETLDKIEQYTDNIYTTSEVGAITINYSKKTNLVEVLTHLEEEL